MIKEVDLGNPGENPEKTFRERIIGKVDSLQQKLVDFLLLDNPEFDKEGLSRYLNQPPEGISNEELLKWFSSGLLGMIDGEEFSAFVILAHSVRPGDEKLPRTRILEEIDKEDRELTRDLQNKYGGTSFGSNDDVMLKKELFEMRVEFLRRIKDDGADALISEGRQSVAKGLLISLLSRGGEIPPKLKLLIPKKTLDWIVSKAIRPATLQEREDAIRQLNAIEENRKKILEVENKGLHPDIAKRRAEVDDERRKELLSASMAGLLARFGESAVYAKQIISDYDDPRLVFDKLVGLKSGRLPDGLFKSE